LGLLPDRHAQQLDELEKKIEFLAQEIESVKVNQKCTDCGTTLILKSPDSTAFKKEREYTYNRPTPPNDRISFYACTISLRMHLRLDWWGFEVAVKRICFNLMEGTTIQSPRTAAIEGGSPNIRF
jgi:hypothetical protein